MHVIHVHRTVVSMQYATVKLSPLLPMFTRAQVNRKWAYYYVSHWFRSGNLEVKGYYCYQRPRSLFTLAFLVQRVLRAGFWIF